MSTKAKGRGTRTWTGYDDAHTLAVIERFLHLVENRGATFSWGSCTSDGVTLNAVARVLRGVRDDILSASRRGPKSEFERRVMVLFLAMDAMTYAGVDRPGDRVIKRDFAIDWAAKRVQIAASTVTDALSHQKWEKELEEARRRFARMSPGVAIPEL